MLHPLMGKAGGQKLVTSDLNHADKLDAERGLNNHDIKCHELAYQ